MRVFETLRIGPVELPNRLALAPVKTAFGEPTAWRRNAMSRTTGVAHRWRRPHHPRAAVRRPDGP